MPLMLVPLLAAGGHEAWHQCEWCKKAHEAKCLEASASQQDSLGKIGTNEASQMPRKVKLAKEEGEWQT